jgi:hypothetical protein
VPSRRTLALGILALRSLVGNRASPSWLRFGFPTPARLPRAHPSRARIPCAAPIEAPRREPVGRRAVGRSRSPEDRETAHHNHAPTAFTTTTASGRARAISPDARSRHPCPPLARGKPSFAILAALRFPNAGSIATGPPLASPRSQHPPPQPGGATASILAARMKSFSESPPIAWVWISAQAFR